MNNKLTHLRLSQGQIIGTMVGITPIFQTPMEVTTSILLNGIMASKEKIDN